MSERKKIFLIFPTQLFKDTEPLKEADQIYLIEEPAYFTRYKFHRLKLAFHRASMQSYNDYLKSKKFTIIDNNFIIKIISLYCKNILPPY